VVKRNWGRQESTGRPLDSGTCPVSISATAGTREGPVFAVADYNPGTVRVMNVRMARCNTDASNRQTPR